MRDSEQEFRYIPSLVLFIRWIQIQFYPARIGRISRRDMWGLRNTQTIPRCFTTQFYTLHTKFCAFETAGRATDSLVPDARRLRLGREKN